LSEEAGKVTIEIEDHGCGFDPAAAADRARRKGNGLDNMRKRVAKLGGEFRLVTAPGEGAKLTFILDFGPNARDRT
jgi:signal transduction histidine kinase